MKEQKSKLQGSLLSSKIIIELAQAKRGFMAYVNDVTYDHRMKVTRIICPMLYRQHKTYLFLDHFAAIDSVFQIIIVV